MQLHQLSYVNKLLFVIVKLKPKFGRLKTKAVVSYLLEEVVHLSPVHVGWLIGSDVIVVALGLKIGDASGSKK